MKLLAYSVDFRFLNAPTVIAQVAVTDPTTGEESVQSMTFADEAGRSIHVMVPNPDGDGMVATGDIDRAVLETAIAARVAEALNVPAEIGARIAAADKARKDVAERVAAAAALDAQLAAKQAAVAALDAELATRQKR